MYTMKTVLIVTSIFNLALLSLIPEFFASLMLGLDFCLVVKLLDRSFSFVTLLIFNRIL